MNSFNCFIVAVLFVGIICLGGLEYIGQGVDIVGFVMSIF